jgi:hypothetical protein
MIIYYFKNKLINPVYVTEHRVCDLLEYYKLSSDNKVQ